MTNRSPQVSLVVRFAAALVLATVVGVATASARPAAGAPRCVTHGLVVWLDSNGNGTAGSIYYRLELTNLSGRSCSLTGYPGVSAVDLAGRRLGAAAGRTPAPRARTIVVAAGRTAHAWLRLTDVGVLSRTTCHPVTAAGFRVYPPNQTHARLVPFPFRACSRTGTTYLHVAPVAAGP